MLRNQRRKKLLRNIGLALCVVLTVLLVYNRSLVLYGFQQAKGQLHIIQNSRPLAEVLADPKVADSLKQKIQIVQEAKTFAIDRLGLKPKGNYSTFYDQKGRVSLWNLSASERFLLEPKLWHFPFLGSFPYKGFFDRRKAEQEEHALQASGYDTRIRPVGGWSTLGWTKDPILSNMLARSEGALAELIIHELTHSTLFIVNDIEFNENLASFIGEKGARLFLTEKYGKNSTHLFEYIFAEEDAITFREHMLRGTAALDSLYHSFEDKAPESSKAMLKAEMIAKICTSIDTLHFHNSNYYRIFDDSLPNNAFFLSYVRYYSAKDSLDHLLRKTYDHDLKKFIQEMKSYHN